MILEILEKKIQLGDSLLSFEDYHLILQGYKIKKLKQNNISVEKRDNTLVIKHTVKTQILANTWFSIINSLIEGLKESYSITLKKIFRKKFEFYHQLDSSSKKLIITLFEKQRKPIIIDYSDQYFNPVEIVIKENEITFSSYSKEVLGNSVAKLIGIRKGKLLRKDLRKFITGYVRV